MTIYSIFGVQGGGAGPSTIAAGAVNTLSLSHFNGADGATTTTDEVAGITHTFNAPFQLDTAQFKFGTASGTGNIPQMGGGSDNPVGNWTSPHAGDWTVEFFARIDTAGESGALDCDTVPVIGSTSNAVAIHFLQGTTDNLIFSVAGNDELAFIEQTLSVTINADTWYHFAFVREGTTYSGYFEGNRVFTTTDATNPGTFTAYGVGHITANDPVWFDEVRISKVARYSGATYTVPTAEFTVD